MSGGSFNYLCYKSANDIFNSMSDLEQMADTLAGLGYAEDAARETTELLLIARQSQIRMQTIINRLSIVWLAVEWWKSFDSDESDVKEALVAYRKH